jgi:hypothetical protein
LRASRFKVASQRLTADRDASTALLKSGSLRNLLILSSYFEDLKIETDVEVTIPYTRINDEGKKNDYNALNGIIMIALIVIIIVTIMIIMIICVKMKLRILLVWQ